MTNLINPDAQSFINTLVSLHEWATNSISYIKKRNHLALKEKQDIYDHIYQYEYHFRKQIARYSDGTLTIDPADIPLETEKLLKMQSKFNSYARFYEFPRYPLPDSVPPDDFTFYTFEAKGNQLANAIFEGDNLHCNPVYTIADLKPGNLLVVIYRYDYRGPRSYKIGWYSKLIGNNLILSYTHPRLTNHYPIWGVSMYNVVGIMRVFQSSRDAE